jgi:multicomponent Na+:H+ antiporter subunit G
MVTVVASALILVGTVLAITAGVGLYRFPDLYSRMHAATKPATLGLVCCLSGSALLLGEPGDVTKILLVIALQFVTAPVGAHLVGRAAYAAGEEVAPETEIDELARAWGRREGRPADADE